MPTMSELKIYKIDIAQGNIVDADQLAQLAVGMPERHVRIVLGTPLVRDPFHPERWDYVYNFQPGGEDRQQRHITLIFDEQGNLSELDGDIIGQLRLTPLQVTHTNTTVEVPARPPQKKVGFWRKLFRYIPIVRNWAMDDPEQPVVAAERVDPGAAAAETITASSYDQIPADQSDVLEAELATLPDTNPVITGEAGQRSDPTLQAGMSLSDLNQANETDDEQRVKEKEELDDHSGLFDGLLRKVGD